MAKLKQKLREPLQAEPQAMLRVKKQSIPEARELTAWNASFCLDQVKKQELLLDSEAMREYFPLDLVIENMFPIFSKLFKIRFEEDRQQELWASGVKLYHIKNSSDNAPIAQIYMDLVSRPDKFSHAMSFPLIAGRKIAQRQVHDARDVGSGQFFTANPRETFPVDAE